MKVYLINSDPDSGPSAIYLTREEADKHAETFAHCLVDEHTIDTLPEGARLGLHLYTAWFTCASFGVVPYNSHICQDSENDETCVDETTEPHQPNRTFVVRLWALNEEAAIQEAAAQIKEKFEL